MINKSIFCVIVITISFAQAVALAGEKLPILEDARLYEIYQRASELRDMRRYDDALTLFNYLYRKNPHDIYVKNYIELIEQEKKTVNTEWNQEILKQAKEKQKKTIKDYLEEGKNHFKREEYDMAMYAFQEALLLDPENRTAEVYVEKIKEKYAEEFEVDQLLSEDLSKTKNRTQSWKNGLYSYNSLSAEKLLQESIAEKFPHGKAETLDEKIDGMIMSSKLRIENIDTKSDHASSKVKSKYDHKTLSIADNLLLREIAIERIRLKNTQDMLNDIELEGRVADILDEVRQERSQISFEYTLGSNDILSINVRDHPELSGNVKVGREGEIILPLTNDLIYVSELTKDQARDEIKKAVANYVQNPYVAVEIIGYNSKKFFVVREGETPRRITLQRMDLTLYDVLLDESIAFEDDLKKIKIMQAHMRNPTFRDVNAHEMIYKAKMENNVFVRPNDIIFIPKKILHRAGQHVSNFFNPIFRLYAQTKGVNAFVQDVKGGVGFSGKTDRRGRNTGQNPL